MERVGHKATSFDDAARWDREQQHAMTPDERLEAARVLRERVYGRECADVREAERAKDFGDLEHLPEPG